MAAGSETVLFNENRRVSALARAFDGSRLAFVVHDKDAARLVTMPAGGGAISSNLMTTGYFGRQTTGGRSSGRSDGCPMASDFWSFAMMTRRPVPQIGHSGRYGCGTFRSTAARRASWACFLFESRGQLFCRHRQLHHPSRREAAGVSSHEGYLEQTWAIDNLVPFIKASAAP